MSKYLPNAFQIPNGIVDDLMSKLSGNAVKCYLLIVRKTVGWNKELDYIPASQFHTHTGIKKPHTLQACITELEEFNLIEVVRHSGKVSGYKVKISGEPVPEKGTTTSAENGQYLKSAPVPKNGTALDANHILKIAVPKNGTGAENGHEPVPEKGTTTSAENGHTSKPNTKPTNTKPIYINNDSKDLSGLQEYTPPVDDRLKNWSQMDYKTLPDHWRQTALQKYPALNEQSLQDLWNGHEAKCMSTPGMTQSKNKWDAGWMYTVSNFATKKIQFQQLTQIQQNRSGYPPVQEDRECKPRNLPEVKKTNAVQAPEELMRKIIGGNF